MEEVRERIHPEVFQSLGAVSYQIARVGDIRPPGDALYYSIDTATVLGDPFDRLNNTSGR